MHSFWFSMRRRVLAPLAAVVMVSSACGGGAVIEGPGDEEAVDDAASVSSSNPGAGESVEDRVDSAAAEAAQPGEGVEEAASPEPDEPPQVEASGELAQPTAGDPLACDADLPGGLVAFTARAKQSMEPASRLLASLTPISCNLEQTIQLSNSRGNVSRQIALLDDGRLAVNNINGEFVEVVDPDVPTVVTILPGDEMVAAGDGIFITHDDNDGLFVWQEGELQLGDSSVPERNIDEGNFDGTVRGLSVDANGYLVADFTGDKKIGFYSLPEIELVVELETGGFTNDRPTHLPDGRTLFRGPDNQIHLVHPDTPDDLLMVPTSELEIQFAVFYDEVLIANQANDNQIWDLSGEPTNLSTAPGIAGVPVLAFGDGQLLSVAKFGTSGYVAGNEGRVFLGGHTRRITDAVELVDGRIATIAADEHIRIWNIETPRNNQPHPSLANFRARDVVVLDDGTVLSGGQRWTPGASELVDERNYGLNLEHIALSDAGELVLSTGRQIEYFPNLENWSETEPERLDVDASEFEFFTSLIISGREVLAGTSRGRIYVWNLDERRDAEVFAVGEEANFVDDIAMLANGEVAFIADSGDNLYVWDRESEPRLLDIDARADQIEAMPDGRLAVATDDDFPVVVVLDTERFDISLLDVDNPDLEALGVDAYFADSSEEAVDMVVAPDGRIATSHQDGRITVATPGSDDSLGIDLGGVAFHLAFDNDGNLIAVLRSGITVWDVG